MPSDNRLIGRSALLIAGTLAYFFAQWVTTIIVVRLAGYESAGTFSLVVSFSNVFMFLSKFGIRNYQVSDIVDARSTGQYLGARMIAFLVASIAFAASIAVSGFDRRVIACCVAYFLFKALEISTDFIFAVFQKHDDYRSIAVSYIIKSIFPLACFTLYLLRRKDLLGAIAAMTAAYALTVFIYDFWKLGKKESISLSFAGSIPILIACSPLMVASLIAPYMSFITRLFVERIYGKELLGYFSAISMVVVVMTTLASAIWLVVLPEISACVAAGNMNKIKRIIGIACAGIALLGALAILAGRLFGAPVFSFIFGTSILEYMFLLTPVLISSILLAAVAFFSTILVPLGRSVGIMISGVAGVIACTMVARYLTERNGLRGANDSYIVGLVIQLCVLVVFLTIATKGKWTR